MSLSAVTSEIDAAWREVNACDEAAIAAGAIGEVRQARRHRLSCETATAEARRLEAHASGLPVVSESDARAAIRLIVAGLDALKFDCDDDPMFSQTVRLASSLDRWMHR